MEKDKGRERVRDGGRGVLENCFFSSSYVLLATHFSLPIRRVRGREARCCTPKLGTVLTACGRVHQCDLRRVQMSFCKIWATKSPQCHRHTNGWCDCNRRRTTRSSRREWCQSFGHSCCLGRRGVGGSRRAAHASLSCTLGQGSGKGDSLSPLLFEVITVFLIYDIKSLHVDVQILLYVTQIEATATGASDCRPSGGTVFRFTCLGRGGGGGYRWTRLPFGCSFSLVVCQKLVSGIVRGVLARLQADGIVYFDDILLVARRSKVKRGSCCVA